MNFEKKSLISWDFRDFLIHLRRFRLVTAACLLHTRFSLPMEFVCAKAAMH